MGESGQCHRPLTLEGVGLSGLGVTVSLRDPRFADSNPAEVDGFPEHKSSGRDFKRGVASLRFQAR